MSQRIEFESLLNTRDLGGMTGMNGKHIRPGKLIRSGQLFTASSGDLEKLAGMTDTIADFRSDRERAEKPEAVVPGISAHHIPIFEAPKAGITRDRDSYEEVMKNMLFDPTVALNYMCRTYAGFAENEFTLRQYEKFIRLLLEPHDKAVLWHCTAGKDRTGFGAVIVEKILGVSDADVIEDYLMTNVYLEPEVRDLTAMMTGRPGVDAAAAGEAVNYIFSARIEYLDTVLDRIRKLYGNFDGYIREGLHITPDEQEKLRQMYLA